MGGAQQVDSLDILYHHSSRDTIHYRVFILDVRERGWGRLYYKSWIKNEGLVL